MNFDTDPSVTNSVKVEPTVVEPEDNSPIMNKRGRRKKVGTHVITHTIFIIP